MPSASECFICGLPTDSSNQTAVRAHGQGSPLTFEAHIDCLIAATNRPNLAALGVTADPAETDRLTPRARRLWAGAAAAACEFGHDFIGTEHLLLAMAREPDGIAGRVLDDIAGRRRVEDAVWSVMTSGPYNELLDAGDTGQG